MCNQVCHIPARHLTIGFNEGCVDLDGKGDVVVTQENESGSDIGRRDEAEGDGKGRDSGQTQTLSTYEQYRKEMGLPPVESDAGKDSMDVTDDAGNAIYTDYLRDLVERDMERRQTQSQSQSQVQEQMQPEPAPQQGDAGQADLPERPHINNIFGMFY
jgi:hypothetical protein